MLGIFKLKPEGNNTNHLLEYLELEWLIILHKYPQQVYKTPKLKYLSMNEWVIKW